MNKLFQKIINLCFNKTFNFILFFILIMFVIQKESINIEDNFNNISNNEIWKFDNSNKNINSLKNNIQIMKYNFYKANKLNKGPTKLGDVLELSLLNVNNKNDNSTENDKIKLYIKLDKKNTLTTLLLNKKIGDTFLINDNVLFANLANLKLDNNKESTITYKVTIVDIVNDNN